MNPNKMPLGVDVLIAARERIAWTFDNFKKVYVAFSGGKDSTVMLHLVMEQAIALNRQVALVFIDLEGRKSAGVLCRTPSIVTIRGWWVRPKFRGQGIGTALLEAAMTYAFDIGVYKIELRTAQDRIAHRLGFQWTGYERKGGKRERHFVRHTV